MKIHFLLALVAVLAIILSLAELRSQSASVVTTPFVIDGTPATMFRSASTGTAPVVLIAHGFAGSQQLMQSFALTFARNGYIAVTFDFPGHGRNPKPLTGSIRDARGATQTLLNEITRVAASARAFGDGRLAVLGHSMASDIVVRFAQTVPDVAATIAVSMFSPAVTAASPRNLLVIVGDWENALKREAIRAVSLGTAPDTAKPGVTYGEFLRGTARRVAFSAHVEHVGVLYSVESMGEALAWLDKAFGVERLQTPILAERGPWILLLLSGVILLARPLSAWLPAIAIPPLGAGLRWRRFYVPLLVPMIATPLILRVLPTHFLPVLVGDYLAVHFAVYGLLTTLCLLGTRRRQPAASAMTGRKLLLAGASLTVIAYGFIGLVWPINTYVTSFVPGPGRAVLTLAMLIGTLFYFLSDEWLTRGYGAARGAYFTSKMAFLSSLGIAVGLDLQRLFFLIIIVPVIVLFFVAYGLISKWVYQRTGQPFVAGFANAVAFAWAIGVTFPLLAG